MLRRDPKNRSRLFGAALLAAGLFAGACGSSGGAGSGTGGYSATSGSGGLSGRGGGGEPGSAGTAGTDQSGVAGAAGIATGGAGDAAGESGSGGSRAGGGAAGGMGGSLAGNGPGGAGGSGGVAGSGGGGIAGAAGASAGVGFRTMWSTTGVATPSQQLLSASGKNTYRTYVKSRTSGERRWAFWISNGTDTTYGSGAVMPNKMGGSWTIETAYVADGGTSHNGTVVSGSSVPVSFGGSRTKSVQPGERFWSDPVSLNLPAGHFLAFTWTLSGGPYPYVSASFITTFRATNTSSAGQESASGFSATTQVLVAPGMIASDAPLSRRLCFLGDSITQGVGTSTDSYGYWVAKIADGLDPSVGVWNLGSGWARAADASSDGFWLYKAKQCDEVAVILGVNDYGSSGTSETALEGYLTAILNKLKDNNPAASTILFTVPTFDFTGSTLAAWRAINTAIRGGSFKLADRVFDLAAILSQAAPNDGKVQTQYLSSSAPPHPNDQAGTAIANGFLTWYKR